jgi:hypothetical protein
MSEIETYEECTCNSRDCYECRRREIDETAERIRRRELRICSGMHGFDVSEHAYRMAMDYRCKAINELAFELATA